MAVHVFVLPKLLTDIIVAYFLDPCFAKAPQSCFPIDLVCSLPGKVKVIQSFRNYSKEKNKYDKITSSSMAYSRLTLCFPCSSHEFSLFSKKPSFLLLENGIQKPRSGHQMCSRYCCVIVCRPSKWAELGQGKHTHTHTHFIFHLKIHDLY